MLSDQFRKNLQQFYRKINNSRFSNIYKSILSEQLDQVEVEPVHIISLTQQPSIKNLKQPVKQKQQKKRQALYKNTDFASVFLFVFLLNILKNNQFEFLKKLEQRVQENLEICYKNVESQDSIKYRFLFKEIFQFFETTISRNYQIPQIQKLFKAFFYTCIERRGLKKTQRQKYTTESQTILSLILAYNNFYPSKKQIIDPTSDTYDLNALQFCINIQNFDERQEWTIGEGQRHIDIAKQKGQYVIYQQETGRHHSQQDALNQEWLKILNQSQQIRKRQSEKTAKILDNLNMDECRSPAKSLHSKDLGLKAKKNNFF